MSLLQEQDLGILVYLIAPSGIILNGNKKPGAFDQIIIMFFSEGQCRLFRRFFLSPVYIYPGA
jgi:hypothetical protein